MDYFSEYEYVAPLEASNDFLESSFVPQVFYIALAWCVVMNDLHNAE